MAHNLIQLTTIHLNKTVSLFCYKWKYPIELKLIHASEEYTHIALIGKLDAVAADQVATRLTAEIAARRTHCLLDISELSFIASLGFRILISCLKSLERNNAKMILVNPQELVMETMNQAKLDDLFLISTDIDQAKKLITD